MMKHCLLIAVLALWGAASAVAQTNLAGRVYHHPNIMKDQIGAKMDDLDKELKDKRQETITKAEKEKGRKLTAEELKELDEKMAEAQAMAKAVKEGMKTEVTVEFKNDKDMVLKADMSISEDALKAAGVSWAKRKLIKAALAVAPTTQKAKYVVKGNLVIMDDGEEKDTLQLSADGKYLSGKMDEKTKFRLTRTK